MSLLRDVKSWIGMDPDLPTAPDAVSRDNPLFVYVMLPGNIQPLERADRFEDPLQRALQAVHLGEVTGGGSQLDDPDELGRPCVAFCGLDVELYRVTEGLTTVKAELRRIGVPNGTVLLYELDGQEYEDPVVEA